MTRFDPQSPMTWLLTLALAAGLNACEKQEQAQPEAPPAPAAAPGVDAARKVLKIGALNDESGPAAAIGKPYAVGKRILVSQINAGASGLLPAGWTVELVERDHGYNPQRSVQLYNEIKDQVLLIGTSFGTPNTLPLRPMLERDQLVAFPASLSSKMAEFRFTPPLGTAYTLEAQRAFDFAVKQLGGAEQIKAAVVYQEDDYGADGLAGFQAAAAHYGVELVETQPIQPGQQDFTAVITALKTAGANVVLLTTLPSATGPILGTAAQLQYGPTWLGNTPAWIDRFFDPQVIPSQVLGNFYWVTGLSYWGEQRPGMADFVSAYTTYGKDMSPPDFYILASYVQGLAQIEAFKRAAAKGPVDRASYLKALQTLRGWNAGGLIEPLDLSTFPYESGTRSRVLKPDFAAGSWTVVGDYMTPKSYAKPAKAAKKPKPTEAAKKPKPTEAAKKPKPAKDAKKPKPAKDAKKPKPAKDAKKPKPATAKPQ